MADARNIVTWALQDIGELAAGEIAVAADALDSLSALNAIVDQFAAEKLAIYTVTRTTFSIVTSTQNYTIGSGATVNVARPVYLDHMAYYRSSPTPVQEIPLAIMTEAEWQGTPIKSQTSTEPTHVYYNPTFPNGTLSLWPIPTLSTLIGVVYAPQQIAEFASLSTTVSLPPGYRRMLVKNLAVELCPMFERAASPELRQQAMDSMMVVKRSNVRINEMTFDSVFQEQGAAWDIERDA